MASFNKVILLGNITKDIELKQTTTGISVVTFSIAYNRPGKSGEVDYFDITAYRTTAELAAKYLKKGSPVLVCGRLKQNRYTDKQGNNRTSIIIEADEITFLASREDEAKPEAAPPNPAQWGHGVPQGQFVEIDQDDENLPF
jgi:single-strand DNA-binding protein